MARYPLAVEFLACVAFVCVGKGVSDGVIGDSRKDMYSFSQFLYMSALIRDWQSRINLQVELWVEKCQKSCDESLRFVALLASRCLTEHLNLVWCHTERSCCRLCCVVGLSVFIWGQGIREVTLLGG